MLTLYILAHEIMYNNYIFRKDTLLFSFYHVIINNNYYYQEAIYE